MESSLPNSLSDLHSRIVGLPSSKQDEGHETQAVTSTSGTMMLLPTSCQIALRSATSRAPDDLSQKGFFGQLSNFIVRKFKTDQIACLWIKWAA